MSPEPLLPLNPLRDHPGCGPSIAVAAVVLVAASLWLGTAHMPPVAYTVHYTAQPATQGGVRPHRAAAARNMQWNPLQSSRAALSSETVSETDADPGNSLHRPAQTTRRHIIGFLSALPLLPGREASAADAADPEEAAQLAAVRAKARQRREAVAPGYDVKASAMAGRSPLEVGTQMVGVAWVFAFGVAGAFLAPRVRGQGGEGDAESKDAKGRSGGEGDV